VSKLLRAGYGTTRSSDGCLNDSTSAINGRQPAGADQTRWLLPRLTAEFGQGFSVSNLQLMRKFFIEYKCRIQQQAAVKLAAARIQQQDAFEFSSAMITPYWGR
jgi:hypothetical protein